jgi:hypothetical protein
VTWTPACEEVSTEAEEHPCWKTLPSSAVKTVIENTTLCVILICGSVVTGCTLKCPINPPKNPNPYTIVTPTRDNIINCLRISSPECLT